MGTNIPRRVVVVLAILLAAGSVASPAPSGKLSGSLIGFVSNPAGVPQMGAAVLLYNNYDRLVARVLTNEKGTFGFESLLPGIYKIRVRLSSFVPAIKSNIEVQPGMRSFLSINLASMLSSIELVYSAPGKRKIINDDWRWALRTATPARPILRFRSGTDISAPSRKPTGPTATPAIFSRTRGLLKVSNGEEGFLGSAGAQADLGTAFSLATSLYGTNDLQFTGNFGYASNAETPTAGFRTTYSNELWGAKPEVALTMRQVFLRGVAGSAFLGGNHENAPRLKTMAVSTIERRRLNDILEIEYGASMESVVFLERLNYLSPFARLTSDLGWLGSVQLAFSSGIPPTELLAASQGTDLDMQTDMAVLALFPRVSLVGGGARVQRAQNFEIAYKKVVGSRSISVGAYKEAVTNAAMVMAAPSGLYAAGDLLPDLSSNSSVFNLGNYRRLGFIASVTQQIGNHMKVSIAAGNQGVLTQRTVPLLTDDASELRESFGNSRRNWIATRLSGIVPGLGTNFTAGYQWTDYGVLSPTHLYLTSTMQPEIGLNVRFRQSLPSFGVWNGRLVATAELRNLLAQGYIPVATADGRTLYLIQHPRAVRGGLSFIF